MTYDLTYNDQCDILFGRIRRLMGSDPSVSTCMPDALKDKGLDTEGLGVSGEQVAMALGAAQRPAEIVAVHIDSIEHRLNELEGLVKP